MMIVSDIMDPRDALGILGLLQRLYVGPEVASCKVRPATTASCTRYTSFWVGR